MFLKDLSEGETEVFYGWSLNIIMLAVCKNYDTLARRKLQLDI